MLNTNARGLAKTSFAMREGKTIKWISKYGSITFNQYGKEFPTGGMNEKGLVVELMWLDETKYPVPDSRPAISVLQWIQYQLDNCSTIEEVIQTDKLLRIAAVGTTPLHYLVADRNGKAATIEFLDGKMKVHKDSDLALPVLTNSPYQQSLLHFRSQSPARTGSSLARFSKACLMLSQFDSGKINFSPIDYSFRILDEVAQGHFTKWSIVYDITGSKILFKTASNQTIRSVDFKAFNFDCSVAPLAFTIDTPASGDISNKFVAFSPVANLRAVQKSFAESGDRIAVPDTYIQKIGDYEQEIRCR